MGRQMFECIMFVFFQYLGMTNQFFCHPFSLPFEIEVIHSPLYIQRTGFPIQIQSQPIVHFKSKNIRSTTDFQHHTILSGSMNRSVGYQKKVVFVCRKFLYIFFNVYRLTFCLALFQYLAELFRPDIFLKSQINLGILPAIQDIIRLILCKRHIKLFPDVRSPGVTLYRQVTSIESIQKIKTNREIGFKHIGRFSQNLTVIVIHQKIERNFQTISVTFEHQSIFQNHQFERPG